MVRPRKETETLEKERVDKGGAEEASVDERADREERIPVGVRRQKMNADIPPQYKGRWFNDIPGRLQAAVKGGYRFVKNTDKFEVAGTNSSLGSNVSMVVGVREGRPLKSYLMVIKREFFEEDKRAKAAEIDEVDQQIKEGQLFNKLGDKGYVPENGIKYDPRRPIQGYE